MLEIPAGISKNMITPEGIANGDTFIHMKGKELFKVAVRSMSESLQQALEESGIAPSDLEIVIPHQANLRIIDAVRERLGMPVEKVVVNIERYGNTSSASIPISLDEQVRAGHVKKGDALGFVAFGGGVTWGASVIRWTQPVVPHPVPLPTLSAEVRA
jgi:3-oxoacyl-[acyl-carrier-protein] synthase-3